jgi:hypothetical protein
MKPVTQYNRYQDEQSQQHVQPGKGFNDSLHYSIEKCRYWHMVGFGADNF